MDELDYTVTFAQAGNGGGGAIVLIIQLAIAVGVTAGFWKTFEKAGKPGWGAIIPVYNLVLLLDVAGRPSWWCIPFVNLYFGITMSIDIARKFGKGVGFGLGLAFLGPIFYPILGFGNARYQSTYDISI